MKSLIIFIIVAVGGCSGMNEKGKQLLVNSRKVPCSKVEPVPCLEVKEAGSDSANWLPFNIPIEGFNYEEGYHYTIQVEEMHLADANLPADGSSIRYKLVKVISKEQDLTLRLNDIWKLVAINGRQIDPSKYHDVPMLEIRLQERRIGGNDGCNNFFGNLIRADATHLQMELLGSTRALCPDLQAEDLVGKPLSKVMTYSIAGQTLLLYNADGKEVLKYRKAD